MVPLAEPCGKLIDGQPHTKESIVEEHKGLVYFYANRFVGEHERDDLISEGFIGLLYAFDRFEPERNLKFSTYAGQCIYFHILKYMESNSSVLYYPKDIIQLGWMIQKRDLLHISPEIIAEKLNRPIRLIERALDYMKNRIPVYLDKPRHLSEGEANLYEVLPDSHDCSWLDVKLFLEELTVQERTIVEGLMEGKTQRQIAENLGTYQNRVSRKLKKLRVKWEQDFGA